jgi:putative transposase
MPGHVHLWPKAIRSTIRRLVKQINGRSSLLPRQELPSLKSRMPALWTNSYFVATAGGATLEIVKQYVANQRNPRCALPPHG